MNPLWWIAAYLGVGAAIIAGSRRRGVFRNAPDGTLVLVAMVGLLVWPLILVIGGSLIVTPRLARWLRNERSDADAGGSR